MVTGCLGISDTYQVWDFRKVEQALGIGPTDPGMFAFEDYNAAAVSALDVDEPAEKMLQYGFCQNTYYMNAPDTPTEKILDEDTEEEVEVQKYANRIAAPEGPK